MPAAHLDGCGIPDKHPLGKILSNHIPLLAGVDKPNAARRKIAALLPKRSPPAKALVPS